MILRFACFAIVSFNSFASAQSPSNEKYVNAADQVSNVWKFPEYFASCMKLDAIINKNAVALQTVQDFERVFRWVGPALAVAKSGAELSTGNKLGAAQSIVESAVDELVCTSAPKLCPAWAVGRTIGSVINGGVSLVRADKKSLQELFEELYLSIGSAVRPADAASFEQLNVGIARIKAKRMAAMMENLSCADPKQTKQGVDALLRNISASQVRNSSSPGKGATCEVLKDVAASAQLSSANPDQYDALLEKCLE